MIRAEESALFLLESISASFSSSKTGSTSSPISRAGCASLLVIWERETFPYFFSASSTATETAALLPIPKKPAFSQNKEHVHHFNRMCFLNRPHRISGRVRAHNRSVDFTGKPCVLGLHGFRATPHNSARSLSRDFYPNAKSPRRRNALCQRQPQSVYRSVSRAASRSASKDRISS